MNIEKLARHLKEFTLDEIEMIAECDCKNELEQLLNSNKIAFEQGTYRYIEQQNISFDIFETNFTTSINQNLTLLQASNIFLKNYVQKYCKKQTYERYSQQFRYDIIPYFKDMDIGLISIQDIKNYYAWCVDKKFKATKIKNTFALLKQLLKYFQEQGSIKSKCTFQVKRITNKNEYNLNRIIFEK